MAQLNFTEQADGTYQAMATINANAALHVERANAGMFTIKQRSTSTGNYATCKEIPEGNEAVVDIEVLTNVFPKYLLFISNSEVVSAEINETQE